LKSWNCWRTRAQANVSPL